MGIYYLLIIGTEVIIFSPYFMKLVTRLDFNISLIILLTPHMIIQQNFFQILDNTP